MKEIMNIALILCSRFEEEGMHIHDIFNAIQVKENDASFSIATIINTINYSKERFALFFYLENIEKNKLLFIGEEWFEKKGPELEDEQPKAQEDIAQYISKMEVENIKFLSTGLHRVLVYRYEEEEVDYAKELITEGKAYDLVNGSKLISAYDFEVLE